LDQRQRLLLIQSPTSRERGASLVEFAIALPLLVLLLFGIIEFGWTFAQNLEVKHVAREVARLASVGDRDGIINTRACSGTVASVDQVVMSPAAGQPGSLGTITVTADLRQITGLFDWALGNVGTLESAVEFRFEQPFSWGGTNCP
jgi:Flp pilus assembly protein TadG